MLLETFRGEAEEGINNISNALLELEKDLLPEKKMQLIEATFRDFHSLKGAARSVNLPNIEKICQAAESVFSGLKKKELEISPQLIDLIVISINGIRELLNSNSSEQDSILEKRTIEIAESLEQAANGIYKAAVKVKTPEFAIPQEKPIASDTTIRIPVATIDSLMAQIEELRTIKYSGKDLTNEIKKISFEMSLLRKDIFKYKEKVRDRRSLNTNTFDKSDDNELIISSEISEFFEKINSHLKSLENNVNVINASSVRNYHYASTQIDIVTQNMKMLIMMPYSTLLQNIPMLVRDLSREQGKDVELIITGAIIETDRRILNELKDPLIHIIRNCIDHGIEIPEIRKKKNKSPKAKINISISQLNSTTAEILITDDGSGIDLKNLRKKVKNFQNNSDAEDGNLTDKELMPYVFHSGISTKNVVSEISGRGLGLAIVREKVERLGGSVFVDSKQNFGTVFKINIPFDLASFHGVEIVVSGQSFLIPTTYVERVMKISNDKILSLKNRQAIDVDGQAVSLVKLSDTLGINKTNLNPEEKNVQSIIILQTTESRVAFLVDNIIGEQEVLIKSLGNQLHSVRNILGATVLGNGKTILVLSVPDLLSSAEKQSFSSWTIPIETSNKQISKKKLNILIAEDSITSRMMLKNILESAGYNVTATVDGLNAYETLASGGFDLVVSDVDMPRMSGFTLTEKIRGDSRFSEIPVILVTSLESKEDRERGIDVGASAYVIKRSFDQSNLLEIIKKII
ncbi:MAG: response regulator [Bacteroidetes bacterium]|nr:response regulator [Bacteroidota bacterium]